MELRTFFHSPASCAAKFDSVVVALERGEPYPFELPPNLEATDKGGIALYLGITMATQADVDAGRAKDLETGMWPDGSQSESVPAAVPYEAPEPPKEEEVTSSSTL